ncbi:hypothetical protein QAD02_018677 [Eretmocerus hayati]|uniref:Uncharacterized protein n=1 Tax=Eretmocerus hayati TaxID=131215 RepID=A0ACC2PH23_9HYME|nr:hypothetical protein QAD02_018677 [Eretmocerus hayati]
MITRKITKLTNVRRLNELQRLGSQVKHVSTTKGQNFPFLHLDPKDNVECLFNNINSRPPRSFSTRPSYGFRKNNALEVLEKAQLYCKSKVNQTICEQNLQIETLDTLLSKPWSDMNNSDILKNFELLSQLAHGNNENIGDEKYHAVLKLLVDKMPSFYDEEIHHLLTCMQLWFRDKKNLNYKEFCKAVDEECLQRYREWELEKLFAWHFKFFELFLYRSSKFITKSLRKVGYKITSMSKEQLLQFAFLVSASRWAEVNLYNLEYTVEQKVDEFSIDELAIITLAFFKKETPIRSKDFLKKMMQTLQNNISTVSDFGLVSLLQILRHVHEPHMIEEVKKLLCALETQVPHRNSIVLAECMSLQKRTLLINESLMAKILERVEKEIESMSIRVIRQIISTLTTYNYEPSTTPFYSIALTTILSPDRAAEVKRNPHVFNHIVMLLSHIDFYSKEALSRSMQKEVVDQLCAESIWNLRKEYLHIHEYVEIEHPEYDGPRLEEQVLKRLYKLHGPTNWNAVNNVLNNYGYKKLLRDLTNICQKILGPDMRVYQDFPLPGATYKNIILCQDVETKEFISPDEKLMSLPKGSIKYAPNDGSRYFALIQATYNFIHLESGNYSGRLLGHIRQIRKLGYTPVVINAIEWFKLKEEEKLDHLKRLLEV